MSPERDPPKMKCLLLLLTFRLVFSDKLDRTYLPPLSATFAGGNPYELEAPLEYAKPSYSETIKNGHASGILLEKWFRDTPANEVLDTEFMKSKAFIDYSTTNYPDEFDQTNSFSTSRYDSFVETVIPEISSYGSFPQKPPSSSYLPSRKSTTQQPYLTSSTFSTDANDGTAFDAKKPGNSYVPTLQFNGSNYENQGLRKVVSNDVPNSEFIQYPNEINDRFLSGNEQTITPKIATTDDIAPNYRPSNFGYYGGNPMIMTAQNPLRKLENIEVVSKFGEKKDNLLTKSVNQNKQNTYNRPTAKPFQTPLVRTNMQNVNKSGYLKTFTTVPPRYTEQSNFPTKTTTSFTDDSIQHQRRNPPVRPKYRTERPQAESDKKAIILNYENVITPEAFSYSFDTSNGIHAEQSGTAIEGVKTKGSYSFTGDDGKVYNVTYIADENGFQPRGDHLPTLPPVSEAIKKLIEVAEKNRVAGIIDDGSYDEKKYGHMNYQNAMDRYRPFKHSEAINIKKRIGNNVSRPTNVRRRPNKNTEVNDKIINQAFSNANYPKSNNSQLATTRQQYRIRNEKESSNGLLTNANDNYAIKTNIKSQLTKKRCPDGITKYIEQNLLRETSGNKLHVDVKKALNKNIHPGMGTELKTFNQTEEQVECKFGKPSGSINSDNQIMNENNKLINEKLAENQQSIINFKPESNDSGVLSSSIEDNSNQIIKYKSDDTDGVNFTGDGYYYVLPNITFSPIHDQPAYKKNTYTTNTETARPYADTIASVSNNLNPKTIDDRLFLKQSLINENTGEYTRKPNFIGSNDRLRKLNNDGMETMYPLEKGRNELEYTNGLDSSSYLYTTTPIPSQNTQYTSPDGYLNQYQTTSYPAAFEPTLPNSINREIINSEIPGVRVSQDFVTTTRPIVFNDGVLEVNQNVKIYGLGRPENTVASTFPVKIATHNNGFFTTNTPQEELRFAGAYPDRVFERPAQDMNEDLTYENEFHTTASPDINSSFGIKPKEEIDGRSDFENAQFTPGQEQTTSTVFTQNLIPTEGYIGEDFSGPKQPQKFDPSTGYYY